MAFLRDRQILRQILLVGYVAWNVPFLTLLDMLGPLASQLV